MDYAYEIQKLKSEVDSLREAFLQSQRNQVSATSKADSTANAVEQITPTTYTKTAYIGDAGVVFDNVPSGNLSVFVVDELGNIPDYMVTRTDYVKVVFPEPLNRVTTVTISIV